MYPPLFVSFLVLNFLSKKQLIFCSLCIYNALVTFSLNSSISHSLSIFSFLSLLRKMACDWLHLSDLSLLPALQHREVFFHSWHCFIALKFGFLAFVICFPMVSLLDLCFVWVWFSGLPLWMPKWAYFVVELKHFGIYFRLEVSCFCGSCASLFDVLAFPISGFETILLLSIILKLPYVLITWMVHYVLFQLLVVCEQLSGYN